MPRRAGYIYQMLNEFDAAMIGGEIRMRICITMNHKMDHMLTIVLIFWDMVCADSLFLQWWYLPLTVARQVFHILTTASLWTT